MDYKEKIMEEIQQLNLTVTDFVSVNHYLAYRARIIMIMIRL